MTWPADCSAAASSAGISEDGQKKTPAKDAQKPQADADAEDEENAAPLDLELEDVHIMDLCEAFARMLESIGQQKVEHQVTYDDTPISLHAEDIYDRLTREGPTSLQKVFEGRKRGEMIGLFLATLGIDVHVHDTYFVVAHFHFIMVGGAIMGYLGGLHFWWPKITGRMYSEFFSRVSAITVFVGFNITFFPQFILGYMGMPRRYHAYADEFQVLNVMSSAYRVYRQPSFAARPVSRRSSRRQRAFVSAGLVGAPCGRHRGPSDT